MQSICSGNPFVTVFGTKDWERIAGIAAKKLILCFEVFYNAIGDYGCQNNQRTEVELGTHLLFFLEDNYGEYDSVNRFKIDGEHDGVWTQIFHHFDGCYEGVCGTKGT